MPKPANVAIPTPPRPPTLVENATPEQVRLAARELGHYDQQLTVWLQQTLEPFRDAINYMLDQLP